jgi:hypothetical protein
MEAHVTAQSQSFRLVERMADAKVHHGQEVRADLVGVRVLSFADGSPAQVRFCEMGPIRVLQILAAGDDRPLPADVVVDGLNVGTAGMYDVLNARLSSNGVIRLIVDDQTSIRGVVWPQRPVHINAWP